MSQKMFDQNKDISVPVSAISDLLRPSAGHAAMNIALFFRDLKHTVSMYSNTVNIRTCDCAKVQLPLSISPLN